ALGGAFADQQVMIAPDVADDGFVHLVAADPDRARIDDAAEGEHSDLGGAATDIHDHRACRLSHRQPGADRGRHRLFDQPDLAGASGFGGFLDGAALDGGGAGGHAHDDLRPGERPAVVMHFADEMLDHLFRDFEIGDDAVAQRADCLDISGGAAQHQLGFIAYSQNVFFATVVGDGDDGWFVEDDSTA